MGEGVSTVGKGRRKVDRSYLHDTDGGLNRQEAFRINQLENKIRNRKTEKGYIIGSDGQVIGESIKSTRGSCSFYVKDMMNGKDAVMTHNHPNAEMGNTLAAQIGLPFSNDDLERAVRYDMKEVRAVTPSYTYSIRRPKNGWGDERTISRELRNWKREADRNYYAYRNAPYRRNASMKETWDRGNVGGQYSAWKNTLKALGWTMTRRKVK